MSRPTRFGLLAATALAILMPGLAPAQQYVPSRDAHPPGEHFTPNIHVASHIPLGAPLTVADIEVEQELSRPYAYVARRVVGGLDVISIEDPDAAEVIYRWRVENAELQEGSGPMDVKYFKLDGRYYVILSVQFRATGPYGDLAAIVFDVTSLPDTTGIREVGRIRIPEFPGGSHNIFAYKHSDGRAYLFATVESPVESEEGLRIYDLELFLDGAPDYGFVGYIPLPEPRGAPRGYHDAYVAYDPATGQDKFYGGGPESSYLGGHFVWDVSDVRNPELLVSVLSVPTMQSAGHTFVPTPDHRHVMTVTTSLGLNPVRFFDLKPALEGEMDVINTPVGHWTPDPTKSVHMLEVRWPYMFVAGYTSGLQVVYMRDPTDPFTYGFWDTYPRNDPAMITLGREARGMFGVDVRNADGLIVGSDLHSGFWAFRMDGFTDWNGHGWGVPNSSSAQDWDNGPDLIGPEGPGLGDGLPALDGVPWQ